MTTFFSPSATAPAAAKSAARSAGLIAAGLVLAATVLALFVAGITFAALAIAFPVAVPLASRFALDVSASDIAIAERLADLWWVFGGLSVASVAAAVAVAVKSVQVLSPVAPD
jgi:hypothetical protein